MTKTLDEYERGWIDGPWSNVTLTQESAITSIGISSSPVASGLVVFEDFAACIGWFWRDVYVAEGEPPLDEEPIPEWRQGFRALLERFLREGYQRDMEAELDSLIEQYCQGVEMGGLNILPDDLDEILESYGNPLVDEEAEDEENTQPPPVFDLNNPDHLAALQERLEGVAQS